MPSIVLVSNTSWYLYNFRRGTLLALRDMGFRVIALAPEDDYSRRLQAELGVEHVALTLAGKGTHPLEEGRSLLQLMAILRRLRPALVFNFTVKANIYSGLACRALGIPYANNVSGLGTAFLHDSWLFRRVRSLYGLANRGAQCVFFQNDEDARLFARLGLLRDTPATVLPGSGMDTQRFAVVGDDIGEKTLVAPDQSPLLQGLQRNSRHPAKPTPRTAPCLCRASTA